MMRTEPNIHGQHMETQWQKKHNDIKRKGYPMFKNYHYSHHNNHVHLWFKPKKNWRWSWNGWKTHDDDFSLTIRDVFSLISKLSWSIKVGCQQLEDGHMVEFQLLVFWSHPLVAMHHGKYQHQAFLESTVLIGSASSRRHKCETTVSPAGPNTVWINAGAAEPL